MTNPAAMRDPPQKWLPPFWRDTCHGAVEVLVTSTPLMIRSDAEMKLTNYLSSEKVRMIQSEMHAEVIEFFFVVFPLLRNGRIKSPLTPLVWKGRPYKRN